MLKHFRVNNFKNFKDDLDIDFSDVNGYKFSQDCITNDLIGKMIICLLYTSPSPRDCS